MTLPRESWLTELERMIAPLLAGASDGGWPGNFPFMCNHEKNVGRNPYAFLEAAARSLAGISPWLELQNLVGAEQVSQARYRQRAQELLAALVNPSSSVYGHFSQGDQPLVEAAFLVQAVRRAPQVLWTQSDAKTKEHLVAALQATREIPPKNNNWLLFSALIEAFFCNLNLPYERQPIDRALQQFDRWYVGDGFYADGPHFKMDYYNSIVIHPMLLDILALTRPSGHWAEFEGRMMARAQRYAMTLLELIHPDGHLPRLGRSLTYRTGLVHLLSFMTLHQSLPKELNPSSVQERLTVVLCYLLKAPKTYDENGWLTLGHRGLDESLAERYISRGSLYAASFIFLPLGLPPHHPFWFDQGGK